STDNARAAAEDSLEDYAFRYVPRTFRRWSALDQAPRRVFPARVSRATVAAAMLDEAGNPAHAGAVALPLEG
ncbi:hypothetical protein AB0C31_44635, partial [Actinoplanes philippinensis]